VPRRCLDPRRAGPPATRRALPGVGGQGRAGAPCGALRQDVPLVPRPRPARVEVRRERRERGGGRRDVAGSGSEGWG
jgi:hypothetical protein